MSILYPTSLLSFLRGYPPVTAAPPVPAPAKRRDPLLTIVVALAVALAVADSSVVVLALPDLYGTFDVSIVAVSWTITAYNLAIVVGALGVLALERRVRGHVLAGVGLAVFAARVAGVRARELVRGADRRPHACRASAPRSRSSARSRCSPGIRGSDEHAIAMWGARGHDRRRGRARARRLPHAAVQLAQHLLAAGAARRDRARRRVRPTRAARSRCAPRPERAARTGLANAGFLAALRRARRRAVPLGAAARRRVGLVADRGRARRERRCRSARSSCAGSCPVLPHASRPRSAASRSRAGSSRSRSSPPSTAGWAARRARRVRPRAGTARRRARRRPRCRRRSPDVRAATHQHRGAPRRLRARARGHRAGARRPASTTARVDATRATTAEVLDSPVSLRTKVSLALDLRDLVGRRAARRGSRPDRAVRQARRRPTTRTCATTRDGVVAAIRDTLTRGFRSSFLIAALFARRRRARGRAPAGVPRRAAATPTRSRSRARSSCSSVALVAAEFRAGARDFGAARLRRSVPRAGRSVPAGQRHRRHAATHLAVGDQRRRVRLAHESGG